MKLFLLIAGILVLSTTPAVAEMDTDSAGSLHPIGKITSVNQLSDVQPTDWAFQALQSLIQRYVCITGTADQTFQGDRSLTRYEFAAGLNACLSRLSEQATTSVRAEDIDTLSRLQHEFAAELATLRERIDTLEARTATLEAQQFSTTTKLRGQVIIAANAGGFTGDRIVNAQGRVIADEQPNPTLLYRVALDLNTSFTGTDSLRILLETGAGGRTTNVAGLLEPSFGSVLDFAVKPPTRETFGIGRLVYAFNPTRDLRVAIGPEVRISDYIDRNRYANSSFRDFSSQIFVNNLLLMTNDGPSSGGFISWSPGSGVVSLRAMYSARDAANPSTEGPIRGGASFLPLLYPVQGSDRGLFGDTHQYTAELEYAPSNTFVLRVQYAGGEVFSNRFDVFGVNAELQLSPQIALFGRYGYGSYNNTTFGNISPGYWMVGAAFPDFLKQGSLAGIALGQPFIADEIGDTTQTNFEAFYRFPVSDNISVTPLIQVVTNPSNQSSHGTIITGTVRTVFSF
jgi:porin